MDGLRFSQTYLYKIHLLSRRLDRMFDLALQKHTGMTLSQFMLLVTVLEHGAINQRQAAIFLGISPAALKRQADLATQAGWIHASLVAKRPVLSLTPNGRRAIQEALRVLDREVFDIFTDADRSTSLMTHIDRVLEHTGETPMKR